jgi:hypothetical protein
VLKPRGTRVAVPIAMLAFAAAAVPAQASDAGAHTARAYQFSGRTSQCPPSAGRCARVAFILASNLHKVTRFAIEYAATCQSDPSNPILDSVGTTNLRTTAARRSVGFHAQGGYDLDPDATTGNKRHAEVRFNATVGKSGKAKGTLTATVTITDAAGQTVDTCTTGPAPVTWTAKLLRG